MVTLSQNQVKKCDDSNLTQSHCPVSQILLGCQRVGATGKAQRQVMSMTFVHSDVLYYIM
jgi:hypothetical protein